MSTISQLHQSEMKDMLMNFMGSLNATAIGDPNEAYELFRPARETMLTGIAAFASAAASNAPKTSALQKSKTAIGLRASDTVKPTRKGDDHSGRVSEVQFSLTCSVKADEKFL